MNPRKGSLYIKYVYWLTTAEEVQLRQELEARKVLIKTVKGVVCTPLDEINKISIVPPGVWNETCARQGSWYQTSDKNGLYLVVSSFDLEGWGEKRAAIIRSSDFAPPRMAGPEEKRDMVRDQDFQALIPPQWRQIREIEKKLYLRWAKRLGSDTEDYNFLYLSHTANHANFVNPRFFVKGNQYVMPYSIDRSAHLCSSCLELFQVLGSQFPKKLVAPCPGATLFARLKPDSYLLVESN